jgi:glycosyltransferase involved in cell wall biosynthesis
MFKIVIVGWRIEKYIERCLTSVLSQDVKDWTACVVLDPSEDRSLEVAMLFAAQDSRITVIGNSAQQFATANILRSIKEQNPHDEDIIVTLDGDDWFTGSDSLSVVKRYYDLNPDLLVTHGSWISYPNPNVNANNAPYSEADWGVGIRRVHWKASHLRTFKFKVWKHIKDDDLKGPDGMYARVAWDLAIMFPMMEMAGPSRVTFVPEKIYTYNMETPYNDEKMRFQEQKSFAEYFTNKEPYTHKEVF